nr:hypothetical protein [Chloroflexia bacterium]
MTWWIVISVVALLLALVKVFDRKVPGSLYKVVLLIWAVGPLVGTIWAMVLLWQDWINWTDLALFVVLYFLTGMGIAAGFHRLLTHSSFETPAPVRATF